MKPILKYPGGKQREIADFEKYIPSDYDTYIEPFLGGGSLYFYLEPPKAIINDLNSRLIGFYKTIASQYTLFETELNKLRTLYSQNQYNYKKNLDLSSDIKIENENKKLYEAFRSKYNLNRDFSKPDVEAAIVYYFINKTAFSGMTRYNSKGEFNVPFGYYATLPVSCTKKHSELLSSSQIYSTDYSEIFQMASPDDFMFLDPPYDCVFTNYGNIKNDFSEKEHVQLASDFAKLNCKALMIIGKTPLIETLYKPYIVGEYFKKYNVNIKNRFSQDKTHLIITNY